MSLYYALLGIIDTGQRAYSGYELKQIFDSSMQFYWNATYTQIYNTLSKMHKQGLLTMEIVHQDDRPNKKMYTITDTGRKKLQAWVAHPYKIQKARNAMLVQLTLADRLDDAHVVALLEEYQRKVAERLATFKSSAVQGILQRARNDRERFFWKVVLEKGVRTYETELSWLESVLQQFNTKFVKT
jgi:DNA-binding PadR family transcriptional regulator